MLIVAVVAVGGGIAYAVVRAAAGTGRGRGEGGERPAHHRVTTPYHDHTDMTGASTERERTSSSTEHQAE